MAQEEVEGLVGRPERTDFGAPEYPSRGFAVIYDKNSKVAALLAGQSCSPGVIADAFRGSLGGVSVGMTRSEVEALLGVPESVESIGAESLLRFKSLSMTVSISEDRVHRISLTRAQRPAA
jgi:hypothetical protein